MPSCYHGTSSSLISLFPLRNAAPYPRHVAIKSTRQGKNSILLSICGAIRGDRLVTMHFCCRTTQILRHEPRFMGGTLNVDKREVFIALATNWNRLPEQRNRTILLEPGRFTGMGVGPAECTARALRRALWNTFLV